MNVSIALTVGGLAAIATWLITARSLSRIVLGFAIFGHATVLGLLAAGGEPGAAPVGDELDPTTVSDPLPQALSLTAIVISFGLTLFLLALARRRHETSGDDLVEDDVEDARVAAGEEDPTNRRSTTLARWAR